MTLSHGDGRADQAWYVVAAIREIGIDRESARAISALTFDKDDHMQKWFLGPLCAYPDAAVRFLANNPRAADVVQRDHDTLLLTMQCIDTHNKRLRDVLYKNEHLPLAVMARVGETGRFVLCAQVFAAYSAGKGQPEPGPYQTGSCLTLIEAAGCKPLVVSFYDEMPDVEITLSPSRD
jgi:hypothetical protein